MRAKPLEREPDIAEILAHDEKRSSRGRWLKWLLLLLLAAAAATVWVVKRMTPETLPVQYQTQPVRRGDLTVVVSATGNLEPVNEVNVGSELSGTVRSVEVQVNDPVKPGQILAKLDTSKLDAQIRQARASLASARAQVLQAKATVGEAAANLQRMRRLHELTGGKTPSSADLETAAATLTRAEADEAAAEAAVSQAEATLEANQTDLGKALIRAPTRGVVLTRSIEPGQTVAASLQAPELFLIAEDLTRMELHVSVDEADVGQVRAGQEATFTVAAYPERTYSARITRVHFGSTTTSGVVTYETVLAVRNEDLSLRPGMTASAEIVVEHTADVLLVPNAALRFAPQAASTQNSKSGSGSGKSIFSTLFPRPPRRSNGNTTETREAAKAGAGGDGRVWTLKDGHPVPIDLSVESTDGIVTRAVGEGLSAGMELITGTRTGP